MTQEQKPIRDSLIGKTIADIVQPEVAWGDEAITFVFSDGTSIDVKSCSCCGVWLEFPPAEPETERTVPITDVPASSEPSVAPI